MFEIKQWAADNKICLNALTSLLRILNKRSNVTFPKDGRTLMKTPAKNGKYYFHGQGLLLSFWC